jgi:hypothetical protein
MINHSIIRKVTVASVATITVALLGASVARAQSSGNFTATLTTTQCTMNTVPGTPTSGGFLTTSPHKMLETMIKTPSSKFTTLLIRPSLVAGLFTNTGVNDDQYSGRSAAVRVSVKLDGTPVAPQTGTATAPGPGITYAQRFQQLSMGNAAAMAACTPNNNCDVDLVTSTLGAHSFDFVAPNVGGGDHKLVVEWEFTCSDAAGNMSPSNCATTYTANTAGACAGPGAITVTQVKNFSQDAPIVIGP